MAAVDVPKAIEQCIEMGVPYATVFSAGFSETGTDEGRMLERRVIEIARAGGLRSDGAELQWHDKIFVDGFASNFHRSNRRKCDQIAGEIAIASQSGGAGPSLTFMWACTAGLVSVLAYQVKLRQRMLILDLLDYIAYMIEDKRTKVVLVLAEKITDGEKLAALARRACSARQADYHIKSWSNRNGEPNGCFTYWCDNWIR